jgi:hypothetical protein
MEESVQFLAFAALCSGRSALVSIELADPIVIELCIKGIQQI